MHVIGGHAPGKIFLVGGRKTVGETAGQNQALALTMDVQQGQLAIIFPALGELGNTQLKRRQVHVSGCLLAGANEVMNTRQRTVCQRRRELDRLAIQGTAEFGTNSGAQLGVVTITRHKHLHRGKTAKGVATQEHAHPLPLLQPQDTHGVLDQRWGVDLEQLVTRVGIKNGLQRLGRMAFRQDFHRSHDICRAAANLRNVADVRRIGFRGVKAQKACFTNHFSGLVKTLDREAVQPCRTMDGGPRHGFGDQDQLVRVQKIKRVKR